MCATREGGGGWRGLAERRKNREPTALGGAHSDVRRARRRVKHTAGLRNYTVFATPWEGFFSQFPPTQDREGVPCRWCGCGSFPASPTPTPSISLKENQHFTPLGPNSGPRRQPHPPAERRGAYLQGWPAQNRCIFRGPKCLRRSGVAGGATGRVPRGGGASGGAGSWPGGWASRRDTGGSGTARVRWRVEVPRWSPFPEATRGETRKGGVAGSKKRERTPLCLPGQQSLMGPLVSGHWSSLWDYWTRFPPCLSLYPLGTSTYL